MLRVARVAGGAAGGVALDEEQFGALAVARRAVGELVEDVSRLARAGEAPEPRAAGTDAPGGNGDAERRDRRVVDRRGDAGLTAEPVASVANALMLLRDTWDGAETPPRILICGSLYLAGEVLAENGTPPA